MEATLLPKWGQREKAKGKKNHSTPNQSITIRVMVAASSHVPFFLGAEYPNGYMAECYFLFLQVPEPSRPCSERISFRINTKRTVTSRVDYRLETVFLTKQDSKSKDEGSGRWSTRRTSGRFTTKTEGLCVHAREGLRRAHASIHLHFVQFLSVSCNAL